MVKPDKIPSPAVSSPRPPHAFTNRSYTPATETDTRSLTPAHPATLYRRRPSPSPPSPPPPHRHYRLYKTLLPKNSLMGPTQNPEIPHPGGVSPKRGFLRGRQRGNAAPRASHDRRKAGTKQIPELDTYYYLIGIVFREHAIC